MNKVTTDFIEVTRRVISDLNLCEINKLGTDLCLIVKLLIGTFQIKYNRKIS